ncbi:thioredoxin-like domain-containing protein [Porphyromonas sp.]|uniref:thioredoxin-like domain-containing protein n=1 Tax=Porphyromonas sp. TaxID=1924944 RepID=UPI0026DA8098|nr:thioredoxin-like domain-containing protein [Porphyromonas sp.]MDO4770394.1 thioredoxin-like domain-containing protein [Porphyromonas sp.]
MKKSAIFLSILSVILSVIGCDNTKTFKVSGHVSDAIDKVLYLEHLGLDGVQVVDSVKLTGYGAFSFKQPAPEYPDFYRLRLDKQFIPFAVDSVRSLSVSADARNFATSYSITGSEDAMLIKEMWLAQLDVNVKISSLINQYNQNQISVEDFLRGKEAATREYKELANKHIFNDPKSPVAYFALFQQVGGEYIFKLYDKEDSKSFAIVANVYQAYYPGSPRSEHLYSLALRSIAVVRAQMKQDLARAQTDSLMKAVTTQEIGYVDIELPDIKGNMIKLSDIAQGHYTLLSFTSMATEWTAQYNRELSNLYKAFEGKGLRIYQVGFDEDSHIWKSTVEGLPWTNVRDKNGGYSQLVGYYNLTSIPTLFIINKSGEISLRVKNFQEAKSWLERRL